MDISSHLDRLLNGELFEDEREQGMRKCIPLHLWMIANLSALIRKGFVVDEERPHDPKVFALHNPLRELKKLINERN
jgi:hypothetical protein